MRVPSPRGAALSDGILKKYKLSYWATSNNVLYAELLKSLGNLFAPAGLFKALRLERAVIQNLSGGGPASETNGAVS